MYNTAFINSFMFLFHDFSQLNFLAKAEPYVLLKISCCCFLCLALKEALIQVCQMLASAKALTQLSLEETGLHINPKGSTLHQHGISLKSRVIR